MSKTVLVSTVLMLKTVPFQTIQFDISIQFSSISPNERALSGATTPSQSGPVSDGNKGVLHIPQSYSITGASPSDCLVSYQDIRLTPLQRSGRFILQPQPNGPVILLEKPALILYNLQLRRQSFHIFSKGTSPEVNVIAHLEFELAYYDIAYNTLATTP